jgi:hypothetical protein
MHLNDSYGDEHGPIFNTVTAPNQNSTAQYNIAILGCHISDHHQSEHRELHNFHISVSIYLHIIFPIGQMIRSSSKVFA